MPVVIFLLIFLAGCIVATIFSINALINTLRHGLPFVSTPNWAVYWLRDNLQLTDHDVVYELGCGDARVLEKLARQHPKTQFIGIEVQWWPLLLAHWRTRKLPNVKIVGDDLFRNSLADATLVYGFFISGFMEKLEQKLRHDLKPGTRVLSFGFAMPGWTSDQEIKNPQGGRGSAIRFYRRP